MQQIREQTEKNRGYLIGLIVKAVRISSYSIYGKIPTLLCGPGDVSEAHTVNESIEVDRVMEAVNAVALMITKWCGSAWKASRP